VFHAVIQTCDRISRPTMPALLTLRRLESYCCVYSSRRLGDAGPTGLTVTTLALPPSGRFLFDARRPHLCEPSHTHPPVSVPRARVADGSAASPAARCDDRRPYASAGAGRLKSSGNRRRTRQGVLPHLMMRPAWQPSTIVRSWLMARSREPSVCRSCQTSADH
jgi:hypothetical protein